MSAFLVVVPTVRGPPLFAAAEDEKGKRPPEVLKSWVHSHREDKGSAPETLTSAAFAQRFGWKNDPSRVRSANP